MQNKWTLFPSWRRQDPCHGSKGLATDFATTAGRARTELGPGLSPGPSRPEAASSPMGADLISFEEIYRASHIKPPELGYGIGKVVEMLQSEHVRGMTAEMKRGAVLMALEAAGVQVEDILQDASQRQRAISAFEGVQQKRLEEFEARKAKENGEIQVELERLVADHKGRVQANLQEVSREQEKFRNWQVRKQKEAQQISEAVALCVTQGSVLSLSEPLNELLERAVNDTAVRPRLAVSGFSD